jgi:hypothetical protein
VPIKKAADGARVREIVVDSSQGTLQPVESRVDRDTRAVDAVVDLRIMLLKLLDALVNLCVALAERVELLEGCGYDAANVAKRLAVPSELQGEREVRIAEDRAVR